MHDGATAICNAAEAVFPVQPTNLMCWVHFLRAVHRNVQKISSLPFGEVQDADLAHRLRCTEVIEDLKTLHYMNSMERFDMAKRLFLEKWKEEVSLTHRRVRPYLLSITRRLRF